MVSTALAVYARRTRLAISKDVEARIVRCHFVEGWGVNTIAAQLGVHHSTVDRVLCQAGLPKPERSKRGSILEPFYPLIVETLAQYPKLSAARLYTMAVARGYTGGPSHFRARVAQLRPRPLSEAFLRLKTLPGEQGQFDWGAFGHLDIGKARRPVVAFVAVLSWSRQIFLRFYLNQRMENFLRGHRAAFEAWGGVPRVALYDNLRSAVLERQGDAIRFHPTLLALAAHYRFEPRPVAVARGNEKGRVERAIRYIRGNFFAARAWRDLDDLNAQANAWCQGQSANRPCPEDRQLTVGEAFRQEQPQLIALPDNPFPDDERVDVTVGKTPYVRFDLNDYSVPHTYVRRTLTVVASLTQVRVFDGAQIVAEHSRSFGKAEQIENPEHIAALVAVKRQARDHRGQDRLAQAAPASRQLLVLMAERGHRLSTVIARLLEVLDRYGGQELELAITEALHHQAPHLDAVRQVLERRREQRDRPPPIAIPLDHHVKAKQVVVRPATLAGYDALDGETTPADGDDSTPISTTPSETPHDDNR